MPPYVPIPVPPIPDACKGKALFMEISIDSWFKRQTSSSNNSSRAAATSSGPAKKGFSFGKALTGIKNEEGSAVTTRGDGAFEGGSQIKQDGNKVYLSADALSGDNGEDTLRKLDAMQASLNKPKAAPKPKPPPPTSQFRGVAEAAASNTLYDLDDGSENSSTTTGAPATDDGSEKSSTTTGAPATGDASKSSAWSFKEPETPQHTLKYTPGDGECKGFLEVVVPMSKLSSSEDINVDVGSRTLKISAPGVYRLTVHLPCAVDDGTVKCKWSKKKSQMTVVLTKQ
eukprot:gene30418-35423_t